MPADASFFRDPAYVVLAAGAGGVAARLARQPLIVGYVLGGIVVSPFTPGPVVSELHSFERFAEIGVIRLMFFIGAEFSPHELFRLKWVGFAGGTLGILVLTAIGFTATWLLGVPPLPVPPRNGSARPPGARRSRRPARGARGAPCRLGGARRSVTPRSARARAVRRPRSDRDARGRHERDRAVSRDTPASRRSAPRLWASPAVRRLRRCHCRACQTHRGFMRVPEASSGRLYSRAAPDAWRGVIVSGPDKRQPHGCSRLTARRQLVYRCTALHPQAATPARRREEEWETWP